MKYKLFKTFSWKEIFMTCIGVILGIGGVALLAEISHMPFIIAPFGASAVLIYCSTTSCLAKPRNMIGGHLISAIIAITCSKFLGNSWYVMALAVGMAIIAMMVTDTVHPPGGATALLIVMQGVSSYTFLITPIAIGLTILLASAVLSSRIFPEVRPYPCKEHRNDKTNPATTPPAKPKNMAVGIIRK